MGYKGAKNDQLDVSLYQSIRKFNYASVGFSKSPSKFFLRYSSGKPISNVTKQLDSLQKEYGLPFINSSNARHVIETLKGRVKYSRPGSGKQKG